MTQHHPEASVRHLLSLKVGKWLEASATGWGIPALIALALLGSALLLCTGLTLR